jgi:multiple sugar transport system permease protein
MLFARLRWRGRDWVFSLVTCHDDVPDVVTMIPLFIIFAENTAFGFQGSRNWINTFCPSRYPPLPEVLSTSPVAANSCVQIPMELSEAAKIDGASELRIWWSIIMPLAKPAVAAVAIFTFQGAWQDFMGPLI